MFRIPTPNEMKMLRGIILHTIYTAAIGGVFNVDNPYTMGKDVLYTVLESLNKLPGDDNVHNALRYLESKGYIAVDWLTDGSGGFASVTLQPEGIDLLEDSIQDAGVQFLRRR